MYRKIIWANDGSPSMAGLLPVVRRLAKDSGAKVIVAHVHSEMAPQTVAGITENDQWLDRLLQRTVDQLNGEGLRAELALTEGNGERTGEVIAGLAQEAGADLIVAGTRRRGFLARVLFGSFSVDLVRTVSCPVLVVPGNRSAAKAKSS